MKRLRKTIAFFIIAMFLMLVPSGKVWAYSAHSQAEALNWAKSQINKSLDYDGKYGAQCVDLIAYYYQYLGTRTPGGNAEKYRSNALPSGWTRVYGDYQPGDIGVWKPSYSYNGYSTSSLGHVGIITSLSGSNFYAVNQNFSNQSYCTENRFPVQVLACAIRPDFSSTPTPLYYTNIVSYDIQAHNVNIKGDINNPGRYTVSEVGAYIWDSKGNLVVNHVETCGYNYKVINQNLDVVKEALASGLQMGENFTFQLWASANGQRYVSDKGWFTTLFEAAENDRPELTVDVSGEKVKFQWNSVSWSDAYNLRIQDTAGKDYTQWNLKELSCSVALPEGSYKAYVDGLRGNNFAAGKVKSFTVEPLKAGLQISPAQSALTGSKVQLTATVNKNNGNYTYKFLICDDKGNWYKLRDYATGNVVTWTTGSAGKKTLYVDVKDSQGTVKRVSAAFEVKNRALNASLTASPSGSVITGRQVKLTAGANGGTGNYTYKFLVCDAKGNWYKLRGYAAGNSIIWTTGGAGKKTLYVDVKDGSGAVKRAGISYEVKNKEIVAGLTASPAGSAITGKQVKLTASATGGTGSYTYKFIICDDKGNWYKLRDYAAGNSIIWSTGAVGKKNLYVDVKDSSGTVRRAGISYEVKNEDLTVFFVASPSGTVVSGQQVRLVAGANGGSGNYTYKFLICDAKGNWYKLRDFANGNNIIWIPGAAGKKTLYVDVKDSTGKVVRQEIAITVQEAAKSMLADEEINQTESVAAELPDIQETTSAEEQNAATEEGANDSSAGEFSDGITDTEETQTDSVEKDEKEPEETLEDIFSAE